MNRRSLLLVLAVLLVLAIAFVSALPTQVKFALHTQGALHPWLHLLGFGLVAALLVAATRSTALRIAFVAALLYFAYATEQRESKADGWPIEMRDVHTDMMGVGAGVAVGLLFGLQGRRAKE